MTRACEICLLGSTTVARWFARLTGGALSWRALTHRKFRRDMLSLSINNRHAWEHAV